MTTPDWQTNPLSTDNKQAYDRQVAAESYDPESDWPLEPWTKEDDEFYLEQTRHWYEEQETIDVCFYGNPDSCEWWLRIDVPEIDLELEKIQAQQKHKDECNCGGEIEFDILEN